MPHLAQRYVHAPRWKNGEASAGFAASEPGAVIASEYSKREPLREPLTKLSPREPLTKYFLLRKATVGCLQLD
jgi:hypothetical protein